LKQEPAESFTSADCVKVKGTHSFPF